MNIKVWAKYARQQIQGSAFAASAWAYQCLQTATGYVKACYMQAKAIRTGTAFACIAQ